MAGLLLTGSSNVYMIYQLSGSLDYADHIPLNVPYERFPGEDKLRCRKGIHTSETLVETFAT